MPLIHDGLVYLVGERGFLTCVEAETGKEVYKERIVDARHRASPLYVDGKIIIPARNGKITVVAPGREFKELAVNDMGEEMFAANNLLIRQSCRTLNRIFLMRSNFQIGRYARSDEFHRRKFAFTPGSCRPLVRFDCSDYSSDKLRISLSMACISSLLRLAR